MTLYELIVKICKRLGLIRSKKALETEETPLEIHKIWDKVIPEKKAIGRVIVIANQKGGVGKTTTAIGLAGGLASNGKRILLIDIDPQANGTTGLGIDKDAVRYTLSHVLMENIPISDAVISTGMENIDILPANIMLAGAEVELVDLPRREVQLREALRDIREEYDYIIIDCPPAMGLLSINGLTAADSLIIPVQCEYYSLNGLRQFLDVVKLIQERLNSSLNVSGILLTMYDPGIMDLNSIIQQIKKTTNNRIYNVIIPRDDIFNKASGSGKPVMIYDPDSEGAKAYIQLTEELIKNG